jgi:hypothetical protein
MKKIFAVLSLCIAIMSLQAQSLVVKWTFSTGSIVSDTIADGGLNINSSSTIQTNSTGPITLTNGNTANGPNTALTSTGWHSGNGKKYWQINFSSLGVRGLRLSSLQTSGGTKPGPKNFKIQYRINADGSWADVPGSDIIVLNDWTTGKVDSIALPEECEDKDLVFIRWIMTSNTPSSGTVDTVKTDGVSKIDDIKIYGTGLSITAEGQTICTGTNTLLNPVCEQSSKYGIRYTYTFTANAKVTGASSSTGSGQSFELPIEQNLVNTSDETQSLVYTLTPWALNAAEENAVEFPSTAVTVLVEPEVILTAKNDTIDSGGTTFLTPESIQTSVSGIRYTWTISTNTNISGASASTGNGQDLGTSIEQTLTNSGSSMQSVTYTLTPFIISGTGTNMCSFSESTVDVLVKPVASGIQPAEKAREIIAWFTPSGNMLHVHSSEPVTRIRLYDLTGRSIFSTEHPDEIGAFEIPGLRQGIYLVQIYAGDQVVVRRVLKQ